MYAAIVSFSDFVIGMYGPIVPPGCLLLPGSPATVCGEGCGFEDEGFGFEYGTSRPGVRSVMEIANFAGSGFPDADPSGIFALGTGM